ncbi:MAG TPA: N-acetylmuramoyl-L-alanine amidase [Thermomicrobiales bacterium]|jgi:N-acetylmuramoyl-L-alanine amidase
MPINAPNPSRLPRRRLLTLGAALLLAPALGRARAITLAAPQAEWPSPPTEARVGLQVGHWQIEELPEEQERLRGQTGGSGGGVREVDMNLAVARKAATLLEAVGVAVDLLPATVPKGYLADAFLAIHCDASTSGGASGYKLARYRDSLIGTRDDALIAAISDTYGPASGLRWDDTITRAMTGYYAYNARRYQTIISRKTPSAIIELGFLTNAADRAVLVGQQDLLAAAIALGLLRFVIADRPARDEDRWRVLDLSHFVP